MLIKFGKRFEKKYDLGTFASIKIVIFSIFQKFGKLPKLQLMVPNGENHEYNNYCEKIIFFENQDIILLSNVEIISIHCM